jgi:hypothetical protein
MLNQVELRPIADVSVIGWSPEPAWVELVSDPAIASDHAVLSDPREMNQLLVDIAAPTDLPTVPSGYHREWVKVEVILQARVVTFGSEAAYILVSTNFGQEKTTRFLKSDNAMYSLVWDYTPGLTLDQVCRLKVGLISDLGQFEDEPLQGDDETPLVDEVGTDIDIAYVQGHDPCQVAVSAVLVRLTFQDTLSHAVSPPPGPPAVDPIFTVEESYPEVFSCGSLGDCGAPQGRIIGKVIVTNPDASAATVNFIATEEIKLRISDVANTVYSLSQSIPAGASRSYWIYGWVGDPSDPFPVDPEDGEVIISLVYSAGVHRISIPCHYIGL